MTTRTFQTTNARASIPGQPPTPATPLLGRAKELLGVRDLLTRADVRLVSLVGPGGVGKTRLALAALSSSVDDFADGACWVALAALTEPHRVWPSVARALGIPDPPEGAAALEVLKTHLESRSLLLALDNVEHLIDVAPEVVSLLEACPQLKILITSRRALRVRSEHEYAVNPLEPPSLTAPLETITRNDAVQLFAQRARAVRSDFRLNPHNASTVAQICTRLDGLPLALELAASRLRLFTVEHLLERLSAPLDALVGGPRDASQRQRSLRATLEWSLTLLEPPQQRLFSRLGVFTGGFDLDAAEAIGGPDVLAALEVLIEQSLVRSENGRFTMLETIRERALEGLLETGHAETLREQHARYFLALCQRAETAIYGPEQTAWIDRLEADLDNLRAAMRWGLEHEASLTLFLAGALYPLWNYRGHTFEALDWMERALDLGQQPAEIQAKALEHISDYLYYLSRFDQAIESLHGALKLYHEMGLQARIASVLSHLAKNADSLGQPERARTYLEEALLIAWASDEHEIIAQVTFALGLNLYGATQFSLARDAFEESLAHVELIGAPNAVCGRLTALAMIDYTTDEAERSRDLFERALEIAHQQRNLSRQRNILPFLAMALADLGNCDRARGLLDELLAINLQIGKGEAGSGREDNWAMAAAAIAAREGHHLRAARLVGASHRYRETEGLPWLGPDQAILERFAHKSMRALEEGWAKAVNEGRELGIEDILCTSEPTAIKHSDDLSNRELEVISLVADGLTDAEIANQLGIKPRTVSTHLTNAYNKFGVRSRTQAVREAQKRGLLETA
jgi:predicted ATPase/DNA-binding CsgD family transcriptional regulator